MDTPIFKTDARDKKRKKIFAFLVFRFLLLFKLKILKK